MRKEFREMIWNKYDKHCAYCGKILEYENMQVDHVIPRYHKWTEEYLEKVNRCRKYFGTYQEPIVRGTNDFENLVPSCRRCNYIKATMTIEKFREIIENKVETLNKVSVVYRMAKDYGLIKETDNPVTFYFEKKRMKDEKEKNVDRKILYVNLDAEVERR